MSDPNEVIQEGIDEADGTSLAEEALNASGVQTPPAEQPTTVPVAVVAGLRDTLRQTREDVAKLQGQLKAQTAPQPELSPLEARAKAEGIEPDEVVFDGKLHKAQKKFDEAQAVAVRKVDEADKLSETQRIASTQAQATMTDDQLGVGLGAQTIIGMGQKYLTEGDQLDVQKAGADCVKVAYRQCLQRIKEQGTNQEKELLEQRITAHAAKKADGNADPEPVLDEIPSQEDALSGNTPAVDRLLAGMERK